MSASDGQRGGRNGPPEKKAERKKAPIILAHRGHGGASPRSESRDGANSGRLWNPDNPHPSVKIAGKPNAGIPLVLQSGELPTAQPSYRIQQRNNIPTQSSDGHDWTRRSHMTSSHKLVDEFFNWQGAGLQQYMGDETQFRVIGVIGTCSAGKSYVLNKIIGQPMFGLEGKERSELDNFRTSGIDVFITPSRNILIDVQPVQSSETVNDISMWGPEKKHKYKEYKECEAVAEHMDVELVMFLLAVCHIVLIVEDSPPNPTLHRLLQMAEMLRPSMTQIDKNNEDSPPFPAQIVFVQNKCDKLDSLTQTSDLETFIYHLYKQPMVVSGNGESEEKSHIPLSKLKIASRGKQRATVLRLPYHCADNDSNIVDVIERNERNFIEDLISMKVDPLKETANLTEKDWLAFAHKIWDAGVTSSFLQEFMRISLSLFDYYKD